MIVSTVIVDKIEEYASVIVDFDGFHPDLINVEMVYFVLKSCTISKLKINEFFFKKGEKYFV
jgi:hypothetical protein